MTCLVDDNGLDRNDLCESALHEPARRQHADRAEHNSDSYHQTFVVERRMLEISGFYHLGSDDLVQMLVPLIPPGSVQSGGRVAYSK